MGHTETDDVQDDATLEHHIEEQADKLQHKADREDGKDYVDKLLKHPQREALSHADAKNGESIASFLRQEAAALHHEGDKHVPSIPKVMRREVAEEAVPAEVTAVVPEASPVATPVAAIGTTKVAGKTTPASSSTVHKDSSKPPAPAKADSGDEAFHDVLGDQVAQRQQAQVAEVDPYGERLGMKKDDTGEVALKNLFKRADDTDTDTEQDTMAAALAF
jgi:hypothetical protein